ncbi:defensin-like protein [Quillaja saponaria]|uniref:Defensin-like protein n=1 Tax=Quillaja saponaria TaxID=32244 RepID=A0AAD7PKX5_QUISA|nr:defensin-like protein [Quillaja saponaria]
MATKSLGFFFLFLIVLAAHETVVQKTEARICLAPSGKYRGLCFRESGCDSTCKKQDHLRGGVCQRFACYCQRNC